MIIISGLGVALVACKMCWKMKKIS